MEVETRFGKIVTREFTTSLQRSHSILLKENLDLRVLFEWLKRVGVKTIDDVKPEKLKEKFKEISFKTEVKFYLNEEVPMLVFHNIAPLQGNFQTAIQEYINLFHEIMYDPKEEWYL